MNFNGLEILRMTSNGLKKPNKYLRVPASLSARSRLFLQKVALGFLCLSRLLEPIRESTRFALDACSYLRYLRFSVFYKVAVSPLSCYFSENV